MKTKLREIYKEHKKLFIAVSIFAAVVMMSFVLTIISVSNHERKSNNNLVSSSSSDEFVSITPTQSSSTMTNTTPTRDIDTKHSTDYDKSIDDLKEIMKSNKWIGANTIESIGNEKDYSFSFDKDDVATITSPYEEEKVLINMKYVKSVIGINNTYRIVCDLSFQNGKYITDSILIVVLDNTNGYEIKCEDFPMFKRFEVNTDE